MTEFTLEDAGTFSATSKQGAECKKISEGDALNCSSYSMATTTIPASGEIIVIRNWATESVSFPVEVKKEKERLNNQKAVMVSTTSCD